MRRLTRGEQFPIILTFVTGRVWQRSNLRHPRALQHYTRRDALESIWRQVGRYPIQLVDKVCDGKERQDVPRDAVDAGEITLSIS